MRNTLILLGLFFVYSIVGSSLAYASNFVGGHYVASSDQPGTTVWLFVRGGIPRVLAAAAVGVLAVFAFLPPPKRSWGVALAVMIGLSALAGWSFRFNWRVLDAESRIGWLLQAVLVGSAAFVAFVITARARPAA